MAPWRRNAPLISLALFGGLLLQAPSSAATSPAKSPRSAAPSPAPTGLSPEELDEIERSLSPKAEASAPSVPIAPRTFQDMNPAMSFILDTAGALFSAPSPLQGGGHDPSKTGFNLQQLELSIAHPVDPFLRFDGNLVFSQFGVEVEEAYATTYALPFDLQARAGQFLTRFGRLNPTHPHAWEFADQPFILSKFMGGEGNRGLGTEVSWLSPLPWYAEVVGSLTEAAGASTARSFFGAQDLGVLSPLDLQSTGAIKQFFPLGRDLSLAWGLSGATGPNPTGRANRSDLFGTDLYLKYRPLEGGRWTTVSWTTEAMARRRQVPGSLLVDYGGYSSLFWRIDQQWGTAARYETGSGVQVDPLDPDWNAQRQRLSANVTFWPTEFSRFRLQGSIDYPAWRPEPIYAAFLTMEVVTGAHGSHPF